MQGFTPSQILSITALQKLSLKRLRLLRRNEPLLVVDHKQGRHGYVILDYDAYCRMRNTPAARPSLRSLAALRAMPFRERGLLWDRPDLTNAAFFARIRNASHPEHSWAVTRLFERLPSQTLLHYVSWQQLAQLFEVARLRPAIRKPWEHAIAYWRQTT